METEGKVIKMFDIRADVMTHTCWWWICRIKREEGNPGRMDRGLVDQDMAVVDPLAEVDMKDWLWGNWKPFGRRVVEVW